MINPILVYIDLEGSPQFVGRLWSHSRGNKESAAFEYDSSWLRSPHRFALEPALSLTPGPFQTPVGKKLFGAIGDSAPDRWGRILMRRLVRNQAAVDGGIPRTLREQDYLLMVDDISRQGALRFSIDSGGPFLANNVSRIPLLINLPRLLAASDHVIENDDTDEDLHILLAPGSSLGGAQPKASVRDKNRNLAIAKFPGKFDEYDRVSWEAVALSLAEEAGINVPKRHIECIHGRNILITERFDRIGLTRIPFLSGMSMIGGYDNEVRSYLELVDAIKRYGANPNKDTMELWTRIVLTVLISNVDDHMRNHAFLYSGPEGWILSPVYDLNPTPTDISPRLLSTTIGFDDPTASIELAFEVCEYFNISIKQARSTAAHVAKVVSKWREHAKQIGISGPQIERMASAFEHKDLHSSLGM